MVVDPLAKLADETGETLNYIQYRFWNYRDRETLDAGDVEKLDRWYVQAAKALEALGREIARRQRGDA